MSDAPEYNALVWPAQAWLMLWLAIVSQGVQLCVFFHRLRVHCCWCVLLARIVLQPVRSQL